MKVLIFSTAYFPFVGGAEIAVKEITDRLPEIEFHMVTAKLKPGPESTERFGNVTLHRVGIGSSFDKFLLPILGTDKAGSLNKEYKFDLAWAIMASQASIAAAMFSHAKKIPLLLTLQEGDEEEHLKRYVGGSNALYGLLIKPWHTLAIKRADYIQVISNYLKERAKRSGAKCKIEVVPNGVDYGSFTGDVAADELDALRGKLGKRGGDRFIITVSRLVEKNGVGDLIRSLGYLEDNYKLIIIGTGEEENELRGIVHRRGFGNRVKFLGQIDYAKLPIYYKISDVFCRPSLSEGFGNVFVEAMAAGVPVVATPVGGITDFLFDPDKNTGQEPTGLFCEVNNPESIAKQVRRIVEDENLRSEIVGNAKTMVREKYDWNIVAGEMRAIFESIANKKSY